ncbi:hypothetical protein [Undibacterium sp.]|jgi:hypothetical protein|uniref:hypothetical protein n=1 Tax=Undibacterium sp. TaxID=1914977 RepID=UPI002C6D78B8|nr:hypothetical protein [Undibacterium sp.]HTD05033.1 hypothetical protein [Undibacterium sp.]
MNTRTRNYLLTITALLVIAAIAVCALLSFGSHDSGWAMTVDGDSIDGIAGAGFAFGGLMIGAVAAVFALGLVVAILAGVSLFLMGLFAFIALAVLLALAPVVLPVILLIAFIAFLARKKHA